MSRPGYAPVLLWVVCLSWTGGCSQDEVAGTAQPVEISGLPPGLDLAVSMGHDHGEMGPHGGHLIELGRNHRYHAELVEESSPRAISVYILDGDLRELSIESGTITLQLNRDDATSLSFDLAAVRPSDRLGTSHFRSQDPSLYAVLASQEITGRLRANIKGVQYIGRLAHQVHDHDDSSAQGVEPLIY